MATTIDASRTEPLPRPVGPGSLSAWSQALRADVLADAWNYEARDIIMAQASTVL